VAIIWDQSSPALELYEMKSNLDGADIFCVFNFPETRGHFFPIDLYISSDPAPSRSNLNEFPFSICQEDQLFTITYISLREQGDTTKVLLFLPLSTIVKHILKVRAGETGKRIPWRDWGPNGARLIVPEDEMSDVWITHTFGMKFALPCQISHNGVFQSVRLYDFHSLAKRDPPIETCSSMMLTLELMFAEPVYTHLPCWCSDKPLPKDGECEALLLTEDALIAVSLDERKLTLLTF